MGVLEHHSTAHSPVTAHLAAVDVGWLVVGAEETRVVFIDEVGVTLPVERLGAELVGGRRVEPAAPVGLAGEVDASSGGELPGHGGADVADPGIGAVAERVEVGGVAQLGLEAGLLLVKEDPSALGGEAGVIVVELLTGLHYNYLVVFYFYVLSNFKVFDNFLIFLFNLIFQYVFVLV